MKRTTLVVLAACLIGIGTLGSAAEIKIGYVNLQRVKDTEVWKRLEEQFQTEVTQSKIEVEQRQKAIETATRQYQQQKTMLSEEAQKEKELALKKEQLELQLWTQERQKALEMRRKEMSQRIWSRVSSAVEQVARKKELTLVIDYDPTAADVTLNFERGFVYLDPAIDITDEVMTAFDALSGGTS